ncbi:actin-like ATPase domain-containing protein [Xylariaceae sp. AK1471]|nr:actin-like ATPase domain-containing protein [Xylariaceae sp. AK1471]
MAPPSSRKRTALVIGIDFGTTYSGVSWLLCKPDSKPGQPEVITYWPTSADSYKNSDRQKVPSKIYYDHRTGEPSWGYQVPTGVDTLEWFKLLLPNDVDLQKHLQASTHIQAARLAMLKLGKTPIQIVGDYLKLLWDHIIEQIANEKGDNLIDGTPFHVVLTAPAIWTDEARERMRQAADYAGMCKARLAGQTALSFVTEPEAGAIATIPELEGREDLVVGDSFVVVDAGGGTVDIISYKVDKVEPLAVSECVEGDGALCGAAFLDEHFEAFLKRLVGDTSWNKMNGSDIKKMMNDEWEHGIKCTFNGEQRAYSVELPSRAQRAPVKFSSDQLRTIFDKNVFRIHDLVNRQIKAIEAKTLRAPKFVILVGGFGRSPYVLKSMKEKLKGEISVLQARGERPWTAICRGAALSGAAELSPTPTSARVQSRVARLNYGWDYRETYVDGIHDPETGFGAMLMQSGKP